jgi:hypothetical protein
MTAAAAHLLFPNAEHAFGHVLGCTGRRIRVALPSGERWADVATSCIVAPAVGDRVLVVHSGEEAYVLAVLAQSREGEARLVFEHGVSLEVPKGRLRLLAKELELVGDSLSSKTKTIRFVAETFDTVAGRIYQRAVNFLRRTDELDRVEAKCIDLKAEQLLHVHGENAITTAEQLVKIDGAQVHVG